MESTISEGFTFLNGDIVPTAEPAGFGCPIKLRIDPSVSRPSTNSTGCICRNRYVPGARLSNR